jgi:uncharacterized membrane protein
MSASLERSLPGPARLEAFSDGVLAIAITLLGYLLSFFFIAVFWVNHHRFFRLIERVDGRLLWLNILLLLALSFIPFPTAMIGEYPSNPTSLALFAVVLILAGIAFNLMWRHARARGLFHTGVVLATVSRAATRGLVGPIAYGLAALVAFVFPAAAWAIFIAVPLIYVFGSAARSG